MPKLIFLNTSTDEDYDAYCDYTLIKLTKKRAEKLLTRLKIARSIRKKDKALNDLSYWDYSPQPFAHHAFLEEFLIDGELLYDYIDAGGIAILPDEFEIPEDVEFQPLDVSLVKVCWNGDVGWEFTPKYCVINVFTGWLSKDILEKIARGEPCDNVTPVSKMEESKC